VSIRCNPGRHFQPCAKLVTVSTKDQNLEMSTTEDALPALDPAEELKAAIAERDQLLGERAELRDQLLRRQADFENFRRRIERERSEFAQYAGMELVGELLPILDNFERALKTETSNQDYAKGVELIYQRLFETLKKMGLEPIEAEGRPFDPYVHEAVERAEADGVEDHTVLEVFQKGYNFRGRLLRPAMVKVAVKRS
jgi:molecular chaperone GrpE